MLRIAAWVFRIFVFLLLLGLAIKNSGSVTLHFFFSNVWELPLILVVLVTFGMGGLLGSTVALSTLYHQRQEIERLKRQASHSNPPSYSSPPELELGPGGDSADLMSIRRP